MANDKPDRHGNASRRCLLQSVGLFHPVVVERLQQGEAQPGPRPAVGRRAPQLCTANLRNVAHAFAALYILETCLLQSVGALDDLEAFANMSGLFDGPRLVASAEIKGIVEDAFK